MDLKGRRGVDKRLMGNARDRAGQWSDRDNGTKTTAIVARSDNVKKAQPCLYIVLSPPCNITSEFCDKLNKNEPLCEGFVPRHSGSVDYHGIQEDISFVDRNFGKNSQKNKLMCWFLHEELDEKDLERLSLKEKSAMQRKHRKKGEEYDNAIFSNLEIEYVKREAKFNKKYGQMFNLHLSQVKEMQDSHSRLHENLCKVRNALMDRRRKKGNIGQKTLDQEEWRIVKAAIAGCIYRETIIRRSRRRNTIISGASGAADVGIIDYLRNYSNIAVLRTRYSREDMKDLCKEQLESVIPTDELLRYVYAGTSIKPGEGLDLEVPRAVMMDWNKRIKSDVKTLTVRGWESSNDGRRYRLLEDSIINIPVSSILQGVPSDQWRVNSGRDRLKQHHCDISKKRLLPTRSVSMIEEQLSQEVVSYHSGDTGSSSPEGECPIAFDTSSRKEDGALNMISRQNSGNYTRELSGVWQNMQKLRPQVSGNQRHFVEPREGRRDSNRSMNHNMSDTDGNIVGRTSLENESRLAHSENCGGDAIPHEQCYDDIMDNQSRVQSRKSPGLRAEDGNRQSLEWRRNSVTHKRFVNNVLQLWSKQSNERY